LASPDPWYAAHDRFRFVQRFQDYLGIELIRYCRSSRHLDNIASSAICHAFPYSLVYFAPPHGAPILKSNSYGPLSCSAIQLLLPFAIHLIHKRRLLALHSGPSRNRSIRAYNSLHLQIVSLLMPFAIYFHIQPLLLCASFTVLSDT
jgi:hypothetical protein